MNIRETVNNLQKFYEEMASTFSDYQASTGLACLSGCGRCCVNPDVEASVLEMLPFALKIYDQGLLNEWLIKLENPATDYCVLFQGESSGKGKCGHYLERPSVCRMFGVAGYADKNNQAVLSICKYIRENEPEKASEKQKNLDRKSVPMMSEWVSQICHLGEPAIQRRVPINNAIKQALEKIALFAQYQEL